jgi:hypothetical protein
MAPSESGDAWRTSDNPQHREAHLPESQTRTRLRADLGTWIRSESLTALALAWGAVPPLDASDREFYQWYDEFSAGHWELPLRCRA